MRVRLLIAAVMVSIGVVVAPMNVFAQSPIPKDVNDQFGAAVNGAGVEQQEATLEVVVARIINATFSLIGVVLLGFMVYAGWLWMTAGGESDKIEQAQKIIRNAIIGLIIVLAAYAISRFVIVSLIRATASVR